MKDFFKKRKLSIIMFVLIILAFIISYKAIENEKNKNKVQIELYKNNEQLLFNEIKKSSNKNDELKKKINDIETEITKYKKDIEVIQEENKKLENDFSISKEELTKYKEKSKKLEQERDDAKKQLEKLKKEYEQLKISKEERKNRPLNSININGENYPIIVGGQDEIDLQRKEFVNVGYYFSRMYGLGPGVEYKTHKDGKSIYLSIESVGYGDVIWDTKSLDFTDINGNTATYNFIGTGCFAHYDYNINEEAEYRNALYAGYGGDVIAIQTCDPDSNNTGKARAYYFVMS